MQVHKKHQGMGWATMEAYSLVYQVLKKGPKHSHKPSPSSLLPLPLVPGPQGGKGSCGVTQKLQATRALAIPDGRPPPRPCFAL